LNNKNWNLKVGISKEGFGPLNDRRKILGVSIGARYVVLVGEGRDVLTSFAHETGHAYGFDDQYAVKDPNLPQPCPNCNRADGKNPLSESEGCSPIQKPVGDVTNSCCGYSGTCNTAEGRRQCDSVDINTQVAGCVIGRNGVIPRQEYYSALDSGVVKTGTCPQGLQSTEGYEGGMFCMGNKAKTNPNFRTIMTSGGWGEKYWSNIEWNYLSSLKELQCQTYGGIA